MFRDFTKRPHHQQYIQRQRVRAIESALRIPIGLGPGDGGRHTIPAAQPGPYA
jgi:hypothetical protein